MITALSLPFAMMATLDRLMIVWSIGPLFFIAGGCVGYLLKKAQGAGWAWSLAEYFT